MPLDWVVFWIALLDCFRGELRTKQGLANIVNLSQVFKSIREYAAEFELNNEQLDSLDKAALMQFFIGGLHRGISERESIIYPTFLSQATTSTEKMELAVEFSHLPPIRHSHTVSLRKSGYAVHQLWAASLSKVVA